MAEQYKEYITCTRCKGVGIYTSEYIGSDPAVPPTIIENPCSLCDGAGIIEHAIEDETFVSDIDWIKKKIKKILQKLDIPEE